jgi:hypothetical protein
MNTSDLRPALVIAVLALNACSGPTTTSASGKDAAKVESAAPAVPVTAKTAFWEMYKSARAWAPDMLPLTIESKTIKEIKNVDGKAGMWVATFGSPAKRRYAKFTYAVVASPPEISKGVSAAEALPWAGLTRQALSFQPHEFTIDSDEAYKIAMEKAGPWLKTHPGVELTEFSMGAASRFPGPVWYALWGDKKLGFFQLVSASTGKPLK